MRSALKSTKTGILNSSDEDSDDSKLWIRSKKRSI